MILLFMLQAGGVGGIGDLLSNYGLLMMLLVVVWLFFFRPQAKKQKAQSKFIEQIKKGDRVVTSSGIIGKVNKVDDGVVTLQVDTKTFLKVTKGSVSKEMTDAMEKAANA